MSQWRTILWLRWRLTCNQWSRLGALGEFLTIFLGFLLLAGMAGSCLAGLLLGMGPLSLAAPIKLLFVWDGILAGFLFFWCIGLLSEIQRSESLDLMRFMHLPVTLRNVFFFNYAASWFTPSILIALPGCLCLALGLAWGKNPLLLLLIPVLLGFFTLITSATYLLRGWLVSLMANARRRRTIIVAATIVFVAIAQLPNFYFQTTKMRSAEAHPEKVIAVPDWFYSAQIYFPPFWVAQASDTLSEGNLLPALLATAGFFTLGGLGLFRAYRATLNFYRARATPV